MGCFSIIVKIIADSKAITWPFDYIAKEDDKTPSIQTRLKRILFWDIFNIGKENTNKDDKTLLAELKKIYIEQEEIQDYYNACASLHGTYQDRRKDVLDIKF